MKLRYLTGIEFTFCATLPIRNEHAYNTFIEKLKDPVNWALRRQGLRTEQCEDQDCLEITFKPFKTWEQIERTYQRMTGVLFKFPLGTRSYKGWHGTGGGHIHQSGFRHDKAGMLALVRLATAHPEINWALNGPEDTINAQSWMSGHDRSDGGYPTTRMDYEMDHSTGNYVRRPVGNMAWQMLYRPLSELGSIEINSKKGRTIGYRTDMDTMEHRYFDAPVDLAELHAHVMFAEHLSRYAERNYRHLMNNPPAYPKPRELAKKGKQYCLNSFLSLVEEIGLRPSVYEPYAKPRFDIRWHDGNAR